MSPHPRQILVIEDDPDVREALTELLACDGYVVTCAGDGREGLERAIACRPRVILLDLSMPVMDGWAFRAAQRADARLAAIPVIVLSATHGAERAAALLEPAAFLSKPVEFDRLRALVRRQVETPRARPASRIDAAAA